MRLGVGHDPTASKILIEAGADLEAVSLQALTPLHVAAEFGHSEMIRALIEAGSNVNCYTPSGMTPLIMAAYGGHEDAIRQLLRAKANPCLAGRTPDNAENVSLDVAAVLGHSGVVQELINQVGIEGCGGARGIARALSIAAREQNMDIMRTLTNAGFVDTGEALITAGACGREKAVRHLLLHHKGQNADGEREYANTVCIGGTTPLFLAVGGPQRSPRMMRLLVDAGADPTLAVHMKQTPTGGDLIFDNTPLALATHLLREKMNADGTEITDEQQRMLEGTRRFFACVEAVHAESWLWVNGAPSTARPVKGTSTTRTAYGHLRLCRS